MAELQNDYNKGVDQYPTTPAVVIRILQNFVDSSMKDHCIFVKPKDETELDFTQSQAIVLQRS